jgi:hypothetical protein
MSSGGVRVVAEQDPVGRILTQPLGELVAPGDRVLPGGQVERWDLPPADRAALAEFGLPLAEKSRFVANFQEGDRPELTFEGEDYYSLGLFGGHELGARAGTGQVWAIPLERRLPISYVDLSAAVFVDVAWRWYRVVPVVEELRYDIGQYDKLDMFIDYVRGVDERAATELSAWWRGLVDAW